MFVSLLEYGVYLPNIALYTILAALLMTLFRILAGPRFRSGWRYTLCIVLPLFVLLPIRYYPKYGNFEIPLPDAPIYIPPKPSETVSVSEIKYYGIPGDYDVFVIFLADLITAIILITGAVLFIRQLVLLSSFYGVIKRDGKSCTDSRIIDISVKLCSELKLKEVPVIICKNYSSPFAMGIFRPKIVLPTEDYSDRELNFILRHELIHIKRHDVFVKLLLMIFKCLNWYNPAAYLLYRQACEDMEITCDETACAKFSSEDKQEYCSTILKGVSKGKYPAMTTCLGANAQTIKVRFAAVLESKKLSSLIPFFGVAICIIPLTVFLSAFRSTAFTYTYITPNPVEEVDICLSDNSWKSCTADSYEEAAETIFKQYMALYTGENVPDYQRVESYCIEEIIPESSEKEMDNLFSYTKKGILNRGKTVKVGYSFITANKCGNTIHNKNFGYMPMDGMGTNSQISFEMTHKGNVYTLERYGISNIFGSTDDYHFHSELYKDYGKVMTWQYMADSGLLDHSWDTDTSYPSPEEYFAYEYKELKAKFPEDEYFPALTDFPSSKRSEYMRSSYLWENENVNTDGLKYYPRKFEYCGYDADILNGTYKAYGNVTDENGNSHGVILNYRFKDNTRYSFIIYSVEMSETTFTPAVYNDSFDKLSLPEKLYTNDTLETAENILEYMITPRNGSDFTVLDYKNLTVKQGIAFAEVKFKGRLNGKYSSELKESEEYVYVKVCEETQNVPRGTFKN